MYNSKEVRKQLRSLIAEVVDIPVVYAIEKSGADRYAVFIINDMMVADGAHKAELEINIVYPASEFDTIERVSDTVMDALNGRFYVSDQAAFYLYRNNRSRVEGKVPHSERMRITFDMTIYERN